MAIVQISRITHRKGDFIDLPQLAGAELGWAVDERRLFIGNGTIEEGAPVIGNTEILTQYSNILEVGGGYTYKGERAGYIVNTTDGMPIERPLQTKLDEYVSVLDFGAVGNGNADDTDAINKALYELYCRGADTRTRRTLFFPAGVYNVTDTILIPPYARLVGDGMASSIIWFITNPDSATPVVRTVDTAFNKDTPINNSGATQPRDIAIEHLGFRTNQENSIFVVDSVNRLELVSVMIRGNALAATNARAVEIKGSSSQVSFDRCRISDTDRGITMQDNTRDIVINGSLMANLHRAIEGIGNQSAVRISQNTISNIVTTAIDFSVSAERNITSFNSFSNCSLNTSDPIIRFRSDNNVSVGDMFVWDSPKTSGKNIELENSTSIAFDLTDRIYVGTYTRESGRMVTLLPHLSPDIVITTLPINDYRAFKIDYGIHRGSACRTGNIVIAPRTGAGESRWEDSYVETEDAGVELSVESDGSDVEIRYSLVANPADSGMLHYSITKLI